VKPDALVQNIKAAMVTTGSGGGGGDFKFLKIDHVTGACSFGRDQAPVPLTHKWAIPISSLQHGFKVWEGGKVTHEVMVPMASQPAAPEPPQPYVGFGENGPRKVTQLNLHSLNELGLASTFSSMGVSHDNRIKSLLGDIVEQISARGPQFCNPVIYIRPGNYPWNGKTIWHFDYELNDWIANDGVTLQSVTVVEDPADLPWDTGDPADRGELL
jgi:hypothetical protein